MSLVFLFLTNVAKGCFQLVQASPQFEQFSSCSEAYLTSIKAQLGSFNLIALLPGCLRPVLIRDSGSSLPQAANVPCCFKKKERKREGGRKEGSKEEREEEEKRKLLNLVSGLSQAELAGTRIDFSHLEIADALPQAKAFIKHVESSYRAQQTVGRLSIQILNGPNEHFSLNIFG